MLFIIIIVFSKTFQSKRNMHYEEQIIEEACLHNNYFIYNQLEPTSFFWKELTLNYPNTPICLIPDSLIINGKQNQITWIYTDSNGHINEDTNTTFKDFIFKLTSYSSPNQLVAILKRPTYSEKLSYSNQIKLLNSRYLMNCSQQQLSLKDQVLTLQRFIKSNGKKAFICRTIYKKGNSSCYIITNKKQFFNREEPEAKRMVVKPDKKSTIVKSKQGIILKQTIKYLEEIVKYFRFQRGIKLTELVGDFIKDQLGNWWLINVKAFKIEQKIKQTLKINNFVAEGELLEKQRYQKTKICRYCEKNYLQSQLTHKITMKMLIQVDKYLLHLGRNYNWLRRSDITNVDMHCLYQEHKICSRCFRLYSEIQSLMNMEKVFLKSLGTDFQASPKQLIISQTNQNELKQQAKNKQIKNLIYGIPEVVQLGPNTNIITKDDCPVKNDEIINNMIRYRLLFFLNEIDEIPSVLPNSNYFLEFNIFQTKVRYKLDLSKTQMKIIPLRKLKVLYFFVNSEESLENYAKQGATLKLNLIIQNKFSQQKHNIGYLNLPLKDYIDSSNHKKDFYKFFHVDNVPYGWGLEGSIGFLPSQNYVNTSRIVLSTFDKLIYLPNQNYYFCEHLPEEWIDQIELKYQQSKKTAQRNRMTLCDTEGEKDKSDSIFHSPSGIYEKSNTETNFSLREILNREIESYTKPLNVKKRKRYLV